MTAAGELHFPGDVVVGPLGGEGIVADPSAVGAAETRPDLWRAVALNVMQTSAQRRTRTLICIPVFSEGVLFTLPARQPVRLVLAWSPEVTMPSLTLLLGLGFLVLGEQHLQRILSFWGIIGHHAALREGLEAVAWTPALSDHPASLAQIAGQPALKPRTAPASPRLA